MRILLSYLLVPALVLAWMLRGGPIDLAAEAVAIPVNLLILSLPQICWFGIARFVGASASVLHAGFIGATIPLVGLAVAFECCVNNANALGWFYYWPLATAGIILLAWATSVANRLRGKNA